MTIPDRIALLRRELSRRGLDGCLVVTDDFHGSEYVGDHFKTREYLSGFTGSAGTLVVLPDQAALWTDGRYFLQAERQLALRLKEVAISWRSSCPRTACWPSTAAPSAPGCTAR